MAMVLISAYSSGPVLRTTESGNLPFYLPPDAVSAARDNVQRRQ